MAVLSDSSREAIFAQFMRENTEACALTKTDLRLAFNAIDDYLETNKTAINNAIPQPARGALSTTQKAQLLTLVVEKRWIEGA